MAASGVSIEDMDLISPGWHFTLGLMLALMNCVLSTIGFAMQRKAQLMSENAKPSDDAITRITIVRAVGVALFIVAAVPDVFSYMLVPQVVCTTVACFRLVLVTVIAHVFLHEEVRLAEVAGMAICTVGTFVCLVFGPRTEEAAQGGLQDTFYHPQVWTYLIIGLMVLFSLLGMEHLPVVALSQKVHYVTLPLATGLAFALEKVFNTEIGFISPPSSLQDVLHAPLYCGMLLSIALLGLLDFYLNLRGAASMPVQVFLPTAFAISTSMQFFQSIFIFGEFHDMSPLHRWLAISGAVVSLFGTLLIQPPRLDLILGKPVAAEKELFIPCDDVQCTRVE